MINPITNNLPSMNSETTINSQELLVMVNDARRQYGESPIRNNDFVARVKDELEGETYEIFVGQKNGAEIEIIDMFLKQALRVAARESKAVRRSLVDQLEDMAGNKSPKSQAELIAEMAILNLEQERRLNKVEVKVVEVVELVDSIARGAAPQGWAGYSELMSQCGMSDKKMRQLVSAFGIESKKIPFIAPGGTKSTMTIVPEKCFMTTFRQMMSEAEPRGTRWYHPKMGLFQAIGWEGLL
ncbi:DNA-binding protein [Enterobacter asburiae]|uniref:DNA-binding protein n=1 Tax=Enterobacter asburiae TaxID=61645 RepID=UPI001F3EBEFF|nr:DNA-binding protein [Enterobacter asburiae]